jgi:hypothetical protein
MHVIDAETVLISMQSACDVESSPRLSTFDLAMHEVSSSIVPTSMYPGKMLSCS